MSNNKKIVILIIILAVVFGIFTLSNFDAFNTQNNSSADTSEDTIQNEWVTYTDSNYNFSFDYPKGDFVEISSDTPFLRVQNYNPQEFTRSLEDKYWIEFFNFVAENELSTCPQHFEKYKISTENGLEVYKGDTKVNELSGAGGPQGMCVNRGTFDLYVQGQDETGENIMARIFDSIKFAE